MTGPIYEIPVTPPGDDAGGWTPGAPGQLSRRAQRQASAPADAFAEAAAEAAAAAEAESMRAAFTVAHDASAPVPPSAPPVTIAAPSVVPASAPNGAASPVAPASASSSSSPAGASRHVTLEAALHELVALGGSDLHITRDAPPTIRVSGGLQPIEGARPWDADTVSRELLAILDVRQRDAFADVLELDFAHPLTEASRFRVNYYKQRGSIGAAFRLIPTEIKPLSALGVPDSVSRFATLARGLVLVTGPTGSGKSTTLAALIDLVNKTRRDHIVTVEDPIEFMHPNQLSIVNQREVGQDTRSFANALKHVLRQDPDVILIGEMRDLETISVALTAAETGHLVFATLHTQDAAQTIDRVIDVFPPHQQDQVRTQLAGTLQGVVCQTLVPKASGSGRVVATEVLVMTPALGNLIREGKTYQIISSMQAGKDLGMHTMDQHLAELVNAGSITRKAAEAKAHDPAAFARLLGRVESPTEAAAQAMRSSGIDFGDAFSGSGS